MQKSFLLVTLVFDLIGFNLALNCKMFPIAGFPLDDLL